MDIALCFDKNIVKQAGVLMTSVFETNKESEVNIHIVHDGSLNEKDLELLVRIADKYKMSVDFYQISNQLKRLPVSNYSPATFIRMFLPEILPDSISRVLYLDVDMVVTDDISPLLKVDLGDYYFACCMDDREYSTVNFNRIGLPYERWNGISYFNTGMMVIDLKKWRSLSLTDKVLDFLKENEEQEFACADQDVLNYLFHENVCIVDSKYNVLLNFMTDYRKMDIRMEKYGIIEKALKNPVILHLYGYEHPWYTDAKNPYVPIWRYFAEISGIEMDYHAYFKGSEKMRRALRNKLSRLGLCAPADMQFTKDNYVVAANILKKFKNHI